MLIDCHKVLFYKLLRITYSLKTLRITLQKGHFMLCLTPCHVMPKFCNIGPVGCTGLSSEQYVPVGTGSKSDSSDIAGEASSRSESSERSLLLPLPNRILYGLEPNHAQIDTNQKNWPV